MSDKNANKAYHYRQLFTETYLSSVTNGENGQIVDKNVYKAIKENNVDYLVDKQHQGNVEAAELYDQQKELSAITVQIRKKFDLTKIETSRLEKTIANLEEQKLLLRSQLDQIQKEVVQTKNTHVHLEDRHLSFQQSLQYLEYLKDVRLSMEQRLKNDILTFKKRCFDHNVVLIRLKTCIKQLVQKQTNKKHLQTKSKLILNTLQQTVKMRESERDSHLKSVKTILMRKLQNNEVIANRERQIEESMYKALTQRLPEQTFLLKKLYCQLFLRRILRNKMNNLIEQYKDVQIAFNTIKKQTKIVNVAEFIEDYLGKDQRYDNLLRSISKNQSKILEEKADYEKLLKQTAKLQLQSAQIDEMYSSINHKQKQDHQLYKKLMHYNQESIKIQQTKIMLTRWATKSTNSLTVLSTPNTQRQNSESYLPNDLPTLKKIVKQAINTILKAMSQNDKEFPSQKKSELKTEFSEEKINLRMLTDQSVLTKQYSRKNFRVRTMTGHEQAPQDHDNQYDDLSEYDFLKYNRRIVKKNNIKSQRPRIKTKLF